VGACSCDLYFPYIPVFNTFLLLSMALYFIYISPILIYKDTLEDRGLGRDSFLYIRKDNFFQVCRKIALMTVAMGAIIVFSAWYIEATFFIKPDWYAFVLKLFFYLFYALVQDIFFFSFLLVRLKSFISIDGNLHIESDSSKIRVVVFSFAFFFSLSHLPNVNLMALSFVFAAYYGYIFYKTPNLYVIVIAHALLGTLLHRVFELHMKIGIFYGMPTQEGHLVRFLIPAINELIGGRW